jgi:hypothetical protein
MTKKISKKDIRQTVEGAVSQALTAFEITVPSARTKKAIEKATKKLSSEVKRELKKKNKAAKTKAPVASEKKDAEKKNGKRVKVEALVVG